MHRFSITEVFTKKTEAGTLRLKGESSVIDIVKKEKKEKKDKREAEKSRDKMEKREKIRGDEIKEIEKSRAYKPDMRVKKYHDYKETSESAEARKSLFEKLDSSIVWHNWKKLPPDNQARDETTKLNVRKHDEDEAKQKYINELAYVESVGIVKETVEHHLLMTRPQFGDLYQAAMENDTPTLNETIGTMRDDIKTSKYEIKMTPDENLEFYPITMRECDGLRNSTYIGNTRVKNLPFRKLKDAWRDSHEDIVLSTESRTDSLKENVHVQTYTISPKSVFKFAGGVPLLAEDIDFEKTFLLNRQVTREDRIKSLQKELHSFDQYRSDEEFRSLEKEIAEQEELLRKEQAGDAILNDVSKNKEERDRAVEQVVTQKESSKPVLGDIIIYDKEGNRIDLKQVKKIDNDGRIEGRAKVLRSYDDSMQKHLDDLEAAARSGNLDSIIGQMQKIYTEEMATKCVLDKVKGSLSFIRDDRQVVYVRRELRAWKNLNASEIVAKERKDQDIFQSSLNFTKKMSNAVSDMLKNGFLKVKDAGSVLGTFITEKDPLGLGSTLGYKKIFDQEIKEAERWIDDSNIDKNYEELLKKPEHLLAIPLAMPEEILPKVEGMWFAPGEKPVQDGRIKKALDEVGRLSPDASHHERIVYIYRFEHILQHGEDVPALNLDLSGHFGDKPPATNSERFCEQFKMENLLSGKRIDNYLTEFDMIKIPAENDDLFKRLAFVKQYKDAMAGNTLPVDISEEVKKEKNAREIATIEKTIEKEKEDEKLKVAEFLAKARKDLADLKSKEQAKIQEYKKAKDTTEEAEKVVESIKTEDAINVKDDQTALVESERFKEELEKADVELSQTKTDTEQASSILNIRKLKMDEFNESVKDAEEKLKSAREVARTTKESSEAKAVAAKQAMEKFTNMKATLDERIARAANADRISKKWTKVSETVDAANAAVNTDKFALSVQEAEDEADSAAKEATEASQKTEGSAKAVSDAEKALEDARLARTEVVAEVKEAEENLAKCKEDEAKKAAKAAEAAEAKGLADKVEEANRKFAELTGKAAEATQQAKELAGKVEEANKKFTELTGKAKEVNNKVEEAEEELKNVKSVEVMKAYSNDPNVDKAEAAAKIEVAERVRDDNATKAGVAHKLAEVARQEAEKAQRELKAVQQEAEKAQQELKEAEEVVQSVRKSLKDIEVAKAVKLAKAEREKLENIGKDLEKESKIIELAEVEEKKQSSAYQKAVEEAEKAAKEAEKAAKEVEKANARRDAESAKMAESTEILVAKVFGSDAHETSLEKLVIHLKLDNLINQRDMNENVEELKNEYKNYKNSMKNIEGSEESEEKPIYTEIAGEGQSRDGHAPGSSRHRSSSSRFRKTTVVEDLADERRQPGQTPLHGYSASARRGGSSVGSDISRNSITRRHLSGVRGGLSRSGDLSPDRSTEGSYDISEAGARYRSRSRSRYRSRSRSRSSINVNDGEGLVVLESSHGPTASARRRSPRTSGQPSYNPEVFQRPHGSPSRGRTPVKSSLDVPGGPLAPRSLIKRDPLTVVITSHGQGSGEAGLAPDVRSPEIKIDSVDDRGEEGSKAKRPMHYSTKRSSRRVRDRNNFSLPPAARSSETVIGPRRSESREQDAYNEAYYLGEASEQNRSQLRARSAAPSIEIGYGIRQRSNERLRAESWGQDGYRASSRGDEVYREEADDQYRLRDYGSGGRYRRPGAQAPVVRSPKIKIEHVDDTSEKGEGRSRSQSRVSSINSRSSFDGEVNEVDEVDEGLSGNDEVLRIKRFEYSLKMKKFFHKESSFKAGVGGKDVSFLNNGIFLERYRIQSVCTRIIGTDDLDDVRTDISTLAEKAEEKIPKYALPDQELYIDLKNIQIQDHNKKIRELKNAFEVWSDTRTDENADVVKVTASQVMASGATLDHNWKCELKALRSGDKKAGVYRDLMMTDEPTFSEEAVRKKFTALRREIPEMADLEKSLGEMDKLTKLAYTNPGLYSLKLKLALDNMAADFVDLRIKMFQNSGSIAAADMITENRFTIMKDVKAQFAEIHEKSLKRVHDRIKIKDGAKQAVMLSMIYIILILGSNGQQAMGNAGMAASQFSNAMIRTSTT